MFAATTEQQSVGFGDLEFIAAMTLQALRLQRVMRPWLPGKAGRIPGGCGAVVPCRTAPLSGHWRP